MSREGTARIGVVAAKLMERLETDGCEIGEVMLLVERRWEDEDGDECTDIAFECTDPRAWIQRAMLTYVLESEREVGDE